MIERAIGYVVCLDAPMATPRQETLPSWISVLVVALLVMIEAGALLALFVLSPT